MTKMFDKLAEELFEILKGSNKTLTLYDDSGKQVYEPTLARRMFAEPDKMLLSVDENGSNSEIKLYLSQQTEISKIERLINTLRHLSTRFNVLFNVRKYGHELSPKDFAYQSLPVTEESIFEAQVIKSEVNNKRILIYKNPLNSELINLINKSVDKELRGTLTSSNQLYVWDSALATHSEVFSIIQENSDVKVFEQDALYFQHSSSTTSLGLVQKVYNNITVDSYLDSKSNEKFSSYNRAIGYAHTSESTEESIFEALTGTTKTSYQSYGNARLVVKHSARVNEEKRGSRTRNINALFVETNSGERFKFPLIHLSGARAWAQHMNHNGKPYDTVGEHIVEVATLSANLAKVNKHIRHNKHSLSEGAFDIQNKIRLKIYELRAYLGKLSRSRGYTRATENISFSSELNEHQDEHTKNLGILLGITEDNELASSLMPIFLLTKGENMVNNNSPQFRRVVALENADDLVETLQHEYGYKEGSEWSRDESGVSFMLPEAYDDAVSYLDLTETEYYIHEEPAASTAPTDKFFAYAKKWVGQNSTHMGYQMAPDDNHPEYPTDWSAGDRKSFETKAEQLSTGLKELMNGTLHFNPVPPASAKPASPSAAAALKIGQLLSPGAGVQNDMLYNYLSGIHEKLGGGETLSPVEKQVANAAIKLVSKNQTESVVDEEIWVEGEENNPEVGDQVSTPKGPGEVVDIHDDGGYSVKLMHGKIDSFDKSEVEKANPERKGMGKIKEMKDIEEWFESFDPFKFLNEDPEDIHIHVHDGESPLAEADEPGAFETTIWVNGKNEKVKAYYDHQPEQSMMHDEPGHSESVHITSVVLVNTGENVLDELEPEVVENLQDEAKEHKSDQDEFDRDDAADMRRNDNLDDSIETDSAFELDEFDLPSIEGELDERSGSGLSKEKAAEHAVRNFYLSEFFDRYGSDFNWQNRKDEHPEDMTCAARDIISSINHYLSSLADQYIDNEQNNFSPEDFKRDAQRIFDTQVKPAMEQENYTFIDTNESVVDEDEETSPAQEVKRVISVCQRKLDNIESASNFECIAANKNGEWIVTEKSFGGVFGKFRSQEEATSAAARYNSDKPTIQKQLVSTMSKHLAYLQNELTRVESVDEVMQRTLPPAHDVIASDVPHDFSTDIESHKITHEEPNALDRLRKLAGM